jgi:hypothetical protein
MEEKTPEKAAAVWAAQRLLACLLVSLHYSAIQRIENLLSHAKVSNGDSELAGIICSTAEAEETWRTRF